MIFFASAQKLLVPLDFLNATEPFEVVTMALVAASPAVAVEKPE